MIWNNHSSECFEEIAATKIKFILEAASDCNQHHLGNSTQKIEKVQQQILDTLESCIFAIEKTSVWHETELLTDRSLSTMRELF